MSMDHHAPCACEHTHFFQQLARTTDCKARSKAVSDATISFTMPRFEQRDRLLDRIRRLFLQRGWDFVALVHHALADSGAETCFLDNSEHLSGMVHRLYRECTRRAAF